MGRECTCCRTTPQAAQHLVLRCSVVRGRQPPPARGREGALPERDDGRHPRRAVLQQPGLHAAPEGVQRPVARLAHPELLVRPLGLHRLGEDARPHARGEGEALPQPGEGREPVDAARRVTHLPAVMAAERSRNNRNLNMSPYQALHGRAPPTPFSAAFGTPPPTLTLPEWHDLVSHVHSYIDGANHRIAATEKATFDATRARPYTFAVGDIAMLYTPSDATNTLIPPWTAGYVIKAAAQAPDFYTVSRRELDGSLAPPTDVPVGRLSPFDTTYAADGGASLQTKRDHHQVVCITQHEVVGDLLSLIVRWHDGTEGPAQPTSSTFAATASRCWTRTPLPTRYPAPKLRQLRTRTAFKSHMGALPYSVPTSPALMDP